MSAERHAHVSAAKRTEGKCAHKTVGGGGEGAPWLARHLRAGAGTAVNGAAVGRAVSTCPPSHRAARVTPAPRDNRLSAPRESCGRLAAKPCVRAKIQIKRCHLYHHIDIDSNIGDRDTIQVVLFIVAT